MGWSAKCYVVWSKNWSKKEETCWETCLERIAAELMELCRDLPNQAWIHGRCLECRTMTWNAVLQISAFLRDGTSNWSILKLT